MKQKTAMTDLLEAIEYFEEVVNKEGEPYFNMVKVVAENLKATTEREQIEEAYNKGEENTECCYDGQKINGIDGMDYYQQKYGNEK